tara:strand:- start:193 stop:513 length:321 start_codon:yes stop_codon:yes gene_type:complete
MRVIITVAYKIPSVFVISIKILVAKADARTLTKLLANKIVHMSSSLSLKRVSNILAFFFPDLAKLCILGLDADVSEVSDPEKNAERITRPIIEPISICNGISIKLN